MKQNLWFISAGILFLVFTNRPLLIYSMEKLESSILRSEKIGGAATIKLDVPFHKQKYSLSCEVASLKMALSAHGIDVEEHELIKYLPFDTTPRKKGTWGDPHKGFVGKIDGKMLVDGYGVYWEPIAELGSRWTKTEIIKNATSQDLVWHLVAGRPIIVWGYYGRGQEQKWITPEGKLIKARNAEHARVVVGFKGALDNPQGFFLIDPIFGPQYWSTSDLMKHWEAFDKMGVVVYPDEPV